MFHNYKEVKHNELKINDRMIFTYKNNLTIIPLKARHCVVVEDNVQSIENGFVKVKLSGEDGYEINLQPNNSERCERYYRKNF